METRSRSDLLRRISISSVLPAVSLGITSLLAYNICKDPDFNSHPYIYSTAIAGIGVLINSLGVASGLAYFQFSKDRN